MQADGNRWPASFTPSFAGTVTIAENGTHILRSFIAFMSLDACIAFVLDRVARRGLYIGVTTHQVLVMAVTSPDDLAIAYHRERVTGSATSSPSAAERSFFLSMYRQSTTLIEQWLKLGAASGKCLCLKVLHRPVKNGGRP